MFKKLGFVSIIQAVCLLLSFGLTTLVLNLNEMWIVDGVWDASTFFSWLFFWYIFLMLLSNVIMAHKFGVGKFQEILFFISSQLLISIFISYIIYAMVRSGLDFSKLDWFGFLNDIITLDGTFYLIQFGVFIAICVFYIFVIDKRIVDLFTNSGILKGKGKLKQIETNLENSRWMNKDEKDKLFKTYKYSELKNVKKDGIPVAAKLVNKDRDLLVRFNSPCHSLIIGSTGSGKTTTFVSPMIQLLGATAAGSSMIITDPKGELFSLHSKYLQDRGYDVNVVDLRDTYSSYRWNPLDSIWDNYQNYVNAHKEVYKRKGSVQKANLKFKDPEESFADVEYWYQFQDGAYSSYEHLINAIKIYKKKTFDEVYEDLNDLVSILVPIENDKDPMWEKGARSIVFAVLLAMLEDSEDEKLCLTKDKFNFFNMTKILQSSNNDYQDLRNYFKGRFPLSKALALSKQVCDAATETRASYMSIVYDKLTLFNDTGICALTSASDFTPEKLAQKPTALFLKIPDEKDTRHNLAAIFILNIYKTLIKIASAREDLSLERNVYFIMDEFGNMPKIEKFDKFITVGRSRKIWFNMIVQSYAQLNNVYGETVAGIIKGNCGIKMFIGSNDMETCKEYSELCGNITVVTQSDSKSGYKKDANYSLSNQTQVRPLIYPSELQRLNRPGDIGHSVIVTFGNYPLKTYFSPSFKVSFYKTGKMDTSANQERYFDENAIFYNVTNRNSQVLEQPSNEVVVEEKTQQPKEQQVEQEQQIKQEVKKPKGEKPNKQKPKVSKTKPKVEKKEQVEKKVSKPKEQKQVTNNQKQTKVKKQKNVYELSDTEKQLLDKFRVWEKENPETDIQEFFKINKGGGDIE